VQGSVGRIEHKPCWQWVPISHHRAEGHGVTHVDVTSFTRAKADEEREPAAEVSDNSDASETMAPRERQGSMSPASEHAALHTAEIAAENLHTQVLLQSNKDDDAMQRGVTEDVKKAKQLSQPTHGSALPR